MISTGMDNKMILWDMRVTFRSNELFQMDAFVESITLCDFYLVAAIKNCANVYDLRKMTEPIKSMGSSMDYQICCVRSFSNGKGKILCNGFFSFLAHFCHVFEDLSLSLSLSLPPTGYIAGSKDGRVALNFFQGSHPSETGSVSKSPVF